MATTTHTDPICGMKVEEEKAAGQSEYQGQTYYFCGQGCKSKFDQNPQQYANKGADARRGDASSS